jgi:hypothetical protein
MTTEMLQAAPLWRGLPAMNAGNSEESFWRTPKTADVHLCRLYALGLVDVIYG